jgi:hypothetical protein
MARKNLISQNRRLDWTNESESIEPPKFIELSESGRYHFSFAIDSSKDASYICTGQLPEEIIGFSGRIRLWCIAFSVLFKGLTLQFDVGPDG